MRPAIDVPRLTRAQQAKVVANQELVLRVVQKWIRRNPSMAAFHDDMVQEGTMGLMSAVRKWQPEATRIENKSVGWSVFAWQWIESRVRRCARNGFEITSGGKCKPEWQFTVDVAGKRAAEDCDLDSIEDTNGLVSGVPVDAMRSVDANRLATRLQVDLLAAAKVKTRKPGMAERDMDWWLRNTLGEEEMAEMGRDIGVSRELVRQRIAKMEALFQEWRSHIAA